MEIRVAHIVTESIMCKTVLHTFQFCLYISRSCDISLRAVRVPEMTSDFFVLFISISLPYFVFLVPFFTISSWWPQNKHLCELSTEESRGRNRLFFDGNTMIIFVNLTAVTLLRV